MIGTVNLSLKKGIHTPPPQLLHTPLVTSHCNTTQCLLLALLQDLKCDHKSAAKHVNIQTTLFLDIILTKHYRSQNKQTNKFLWFLMKT